MDRFMAAFLGAERPRTSRIVRMALEGIVFPFTKSFPDRMNRRQINDIKSHRRNSSQLLFAISKSAVKAGSRSKRSGAKLVPSAGAGENWFDHHLKLLTIPSRARTVGVPVHPFREIVALDETETIGKRFWGRSEEHTSELQSRGHLVCRLLLEKKKTTKARTVERSTPHS